MERLFNDTNEPFWRSAKQVEFGVIAQDTFAPFIRERFDITGRAILGSGVPGAASNPPSAWIIRLDV